MKANYQGGYTVSENGSQYDRGVAAGEISARLAGHDKHFAAINGSLEKVASELHQLRMELQRQGDRAEADRATVITTAEALEKADSARRDAGEQRWSPLTRFAAVVGAVAALGGIVFGIWALTHP
jgi:hypothetical protein